VPVQASLPGPIPALTSVPNLRDVGGKPTRDGQRVRTGLLYRSGALQGLEATDLRALARLGIVRVYDLRGTRERELAPDRRLPGASYVHWDVLADWIEGHPDRIFGLFADPDAARRELGGGRAEALWLDQYRRLVTLPSARVAYGRLFRDLARPEHRPALIHCSGGKDRTGWAAAALLLLLDVAPDIVLADFRLSDSRTTASGAAVLAELAARGGDPALWRAIFAADPRYLEAALDEVRRSFGSIGAYFAEGLSVDEPIQAELRAAFVA